MTHFLEAELSKGDPPSGAGALGVCREEVDVIIRAEGARVGNGWRLHPGSVFVSAEGLAPSSDLLLRRASGNCIRGHFLTNGSKR